MAATVRDSSIYELECGTGVGWRSRTPQNNDFYVGLRDVNLENLAEIGNNASSESAKCGFPLVEPLGPRGGSPTPIGVWRRAHGVKRAQRTEKSTPNVMKQNLANNPSLESAKGGSVTAELPGPRGEMPPPRGASMMGERRGRAQRTSKSTSNVLKTNWPT